VRKDLRVVLPRRVSLGCLFAQNVAANSSVVAPVPSPEMTRKVFLPRESATTVWNIAARISVTEAAWNG